MRGYKQLRQLRVGLVTSRTFSTSSKPDVIVLGAGHNGLVAATLLARQGLKVSMSGVAHIWLSVQLSTKTLHATHR